MGRAEGHPRNTSEAVGLTRPSYFTQQLLDLGEVSWEFGLHSGIGLVVLYKGTGGHLKKTGVIYRGDTFLLCIQHVCRKGC